MNSFFAKIMGANEQVRQPRFAGTWYPSETQVLDNDLSRYMQTAKEQFAKHPTDIQKQNTGSNILAIISPHAGYMFSGRTAAFVYQDLNPNKYKRVFLLGPSHHVAFKGVALPSETSFATPLGDIQVDKIVVQKFLKQPYFKELDTVFDSEHSLEMQLPWIRKTLGNVKLVPLAIGIVGPEEITQIANAIKNELTDGDIVIVSSDFTHYGPRFDYQPFGDEQTLESLQAKIKELDLRAFNCLKTLDSQTLLEFSLQYSFISFAC
jgi:AmmeMemoRadiSam system protein B